MARVATGSCLPEPSKQVNFGEFSLILIIMITREIIYAGKAS